MVWITLIVLGALALLITKAIDDGPQHWLGHILLAIFVGAVLYQMYVRL